MIKEIKYSGYTAQPSDYEAPDGDLALSLNLINDNGNLVAINQPDADSAFQLQAGEKVLFIHNVPGQKNYILLRPGTGDYVNVYWLKKSSSTNDSGDALLLATLNKVLSLDAVGNTLIIATEDGLEYFLWRGDNYTRLKSRPPFISIDFGAYKVGTLTDKNEVTIPGQCAPSWSSFRDPPDKAMLEEFTQMGYGLLLSTIADKVTSEGLFYQPFFVRYAYRLYDGSYNWHSAPILILPTIIPPLIKYSDGITNPTSNPVSATIQLDVPYFGLAYRILSDAVTELHDWSDIIAGIDIFISAPIYTYDQSKNLPVRPVRSVDDILMGVSPDKSMSSSGRPTEVLADEVFVGHYGDSILSGYVDQSIKKADYSQLCLYIPQHESFYDNVRDTHDFYKVAEIDLNNIKAMKSMVQLKFKEKNLSSLTSRQRLEDEYQSHCKIAASSVYAFNSRLNLGGVRIAPPEPFPIRSIMQYGDPAGQSAASVRITVWTRLNGIKCYAVHNGTSSIEADVWHNPEKNFPRYIYYPDASAYKMEFYLSETQKYTIDLVPHDFLNGAYYFMGKEGMGVNSLPTNVEPETAECPSSIYAGSKIYTSEVNNPFLFTATGINTVGSGDVYAICTAAKALSQGQFGQFPLYAFTSEGVWALETGANGAYVARQPITRDVCINPDGITQIDSAVLFPTDRGIMLISGSQTECISDTINSDTPFDLMLLPGMAKIHAMLGHLDSATRPDTCLPILPFTEFLSGCGMLYDYVHQRVIVFNSKYTYAYVYSLGTRLWGMMYSDISTAVKSYPEALAINKNNSLVDFSSLSEGNVPALLVTRPLKLDAPDILKTVDTIIQRGHFSKGHVQSVLYGSRDLMNWSLVWSSKDHYLRGFRGTPYKYFRIALLCNLSPDESISGASVQFIPRKTNQLR